MRVAAAGTAGAVAVAGVSLALAFFLGGKSTARRE